MKKIFKYVMVTLVFLLTFLTNVTVFGFNHTTSHETYTQVKIPATCTSNRK